MLAAARYLEERKTSYSYRAPSKLVIVERDSFIQRVFTDGKIKVSQEVANELSGFNTHRFRLAVVSWLVDNNYLVSKFETPAFRKMIALANLEAEAALWASYYSVSRYVLRLYNYLKPRVIKELSQLISKIYISFDG